MPTKTLTLLLIANLLVLATSALAQSGAWSGCAGFSARQGHTTLEFNGKLWLLGGVAADGKCLNDVWSSTDGAHWTLESAAAAWSPRSRHQSVAFNGRMWVLGGQEGFYAKGDVWSSTDGVNWNLETAAAPWSARGAHTVNVFNGELWLMGGRAQGYSESGLKDVWTSADGIHWTQHPDAPWPSRQDHAAVVFNNRLMVLGGYADYYFKADVWCHDGSGWSQLTATAWPGGFGPRTGVQALAHNSKVWAIGGQHGLGPLGSHRTCGEVWSSDDGIVWTCVTSGFGWADRAFHSVATFNNSMWVLAGLARQWNGGLYGPGAPGEAVSDVWSSTDGAIWSMATAAGGFDAWSARTGHSSLAMNNRLWVLGGRSRASSGTPVLNNDVWSSPDGTAWTRETAAAAWPACENHTSAVFNGQMWMIGGHIGTSLSAGIWSSSDGINWTAVNAGPRFTAREHHATVVFMNRLWVIGGFDGTYRSDVWSSADGVSWTLESAAPGWHERTGHAVTVHNNRMWLAGGNWGTLLLNDVWFSDDGVNWTQATGSAPWAARYGHTMTSIHGHLWLAGGMLHAASREVWTSSDGVNWSQQAAASWPGRIGHSATVFDNELWILGGQYFTNLVYAVHYPVADVWACTIAPHITSVPPTTAVAGSPYTYAVDCQGSTATIAATALPSWLSLTGNVLSGTPSGADVGLSATITLTASNAGGFDDQSFQIAVAGVSGTIVSHPPTTATAGVIYSYQVVTSGGIPAPTLTATGLPSWLAFDAQTGVLTGVPGAADIGLTGQIEIIATNYASQDFVQSFMINVLGAAPQIVSTPPTTVVAGKTYRYALSVQGLPAPAYTTGPLPSWLMFDPATATLHGVVPLGESGRVALSIAVDNGWGSDSQSFEVSILDPAQNRAEDSQGCAAAVGSSFLPVGMILLPLLRRRRRLARKRQEDRRADAAQSRTARRS